MTAVVPPAQTMPPRTLAIRNFQYGIRSTPASGPAKMRRSATKRPKNTAHMPHFWKDRSAVAMWPSLKCLGNFLPSRASSGRPPLRPMAYPIESPITAPALAQAPRTSGSMPPCWEESRAAETRMISPGNGMPRLSRPMTSPTTA